MLILLVVLTAIGAVMVDVLLLVGIEEFRKRSGILLLRKIGREKRERGEVSEDVRM